MSKKMKIIFTIALSLIICVVSAYFLLRFIFDEESRDCFKGEEFSINPDMILEDLPKNKTDVFTPQEYMPDEKSLEYVEWKPEDFDLIAEALHEFMWEETLEGWKLTAINFAWDCEHIDKGPQEAHYRYFKVEKLRLKKTRFESSLGILPNWDTVGATMCEYYPVEVRWSEIDLTQLGISAEEALGIAERNGGAETRAAVGNSCQISVLLNPALNYDGWHVRYSYLGTIDEYYIDPVTGEVVAQMEP